MMTASTITLDDIGRCPHRSLSATHYRPDGSCLCRTPTGELQAIVVTVDGGFPASGRKKRYVVVEEYECFLNVADQALPLVPPAHSSHGNTHAALARAREEIL